ncbi:hypothetical protein FE257_002844 [Aspergillus nanangensis]|uniref:Zn(2)-C6 fungal-type domain-containing protein n=1 Tax=Aspergillus nanangensis TaxID=2582783 RepID=A0AAD4GWH2_ASPNN|nr:hypothetical protein FE257_002844 [Aspergillus nanangensis]
MSMTPSAYLLGNSIRSLKSRLGCKTCKIRRVKCGEEKPNCVRCTSTGRKCEYEATVSTMSSPPDGSLALSPNTTWRERRAFAFYFQSAAQSLGGELDVSFWRTTVPQVCRNEPAVWDAIISIGALFESPEPCPHLVVRHRDGPRSLNQNHRDALGWYSRAVSTVRQRIERGGVDIFIGLISCILFICIEALQGGVDEAVRLYGQGVHLIFALRAQIACGVLPAAKAPLLEDTVVPIFARLGVIAFTTAGIPGSDILRGPGSDLAGTREFGSLKSAREAMIYLTTEAQLFERACGDHLRDSFPSHVPPEVVHQQMVLSARLDSWHAAYTRLVESLCAKDALTPHQIATNAILLSHYEMLFVLLAVCVTSSQIITDSYLPNFQNVIDQCRVALDASMRADSTQLPYTFDIDVGFPLWFTSLRCREPRIRRMALALLRRAPRVQGFYNSSLGVDMAEAIMTLEETYGMAMNGAVDVTIPGGSTQLPPLIEHQPLDRDSMDDAGSLVVSPDWKTHPSRLIPEEARIMPAGVFRRQNGLLPPGMNEEEVARWSQSSDQTFLRILRKEHDRTTDTWNVIHEYLPIDR